MKSATYGFIKAAYTAKYVSQLTTIILLSFRQRLQIVSNNSGAGSRRVQADFSLGYWGEKLTTFLHRVPKLRMHGFTSPLLHTISLYDV